MKSPKAPHLLVDGIILSALSGILNAAAPDDRLFESDRAWLERYDTTLLASRASSEFSYESHDNDSDFYKIENTMRWGIPLKEDYAVGFQFLLPVKWTETATDEQFGLGGPKLYLLDASDRHRLELSTTRVWGADREFAWSIGTEVPLSSESFEFKLSTGIVWFF